MITGRAPERLIVPVGGGGMLAGCLTWLAERHPETKVVGAEPSGAASMAIALEAGRPRDLPRLDTFVDGAAVRRVGDLPFSIAQRLKPHMVSVPEGRICSEMLELYQTDGVIAEPAGALASAALGIYRPNAGRVVVAIISGGNNDLSRYAEITERALVYEGRKHYFLVDFPQEPGALRRFLDEVLGPDDDPALREAHGYVFEVPASGESTARPLKALGRFVHEAVAVDPHTGILYQTEDADRAGLVAEARERARVGCRGAYEAQHLIGGTVEAQGLVIGIGGGHRGPEVKGAPAAGSSRARPRPCRRRTSNPSWSCATPTG